MAPNRTLALASAAKAISRTMKSQENRSATPPATAAAPGERRTIMKANTTSAAAIAEPMKKAARTGVGQQAYDLRHHGSEARRLSSPRTRASRPAGAFRSGSDRSRRCIEASSFSGSLGLILGSMGKGCHGLAAAGQELRERGAGPQDVGLHLGKGDAQPAGDFVV